MIDPTCLFHGRKKSEHDCLVCCLCFEDLTFEKCHIREDGEREDVCNPCAKREEELVWQKQQRMKTASQ